jgi:hypothetical protein
MSECCSPIKDSYVVPDSENIHNLGPGCFVRIKRHSEDIWVEITDGADGRFQGIMHPELTGSTVAKGASETEMTIDLEARQINALGCDRFCYCD